MRRCAGRGAAVCARSSGLRALCSVEQQSEGSSEANERGASELNDRFRVDLGLEWKMSSQTLLKGKTARCVAIETGFESRTIKGTAEGDTSKGGANNDKKLEQTRS